MATLTTLYAQENICSSGLHEINRNIRVQSPWPQMRQTLTSFPLLHISVDKSVQESNQSEILKGVTRIFNELALQRSK